MKADPDAIPVRRRHEFKAMLEIDRSDIEDHLRSQASQFHDIAEQVVRVTAERDALKLEVEELNASIDKELRAKAAKSEAKTTETGISNAIKNDKRMQDKQAEFLAVKEDLELWQALRESWHQRHGMLKALFEIEMRKLDLEIFMSRAERDANELNRKRGERNDIGAEKLRAKKDKR